VAMEGDYRALESAYTGAAGQPGQPLLVSLETTIAQRPSMEHGRGPQAILVVEQFIAVWPRESCAGAAADSALRGTYWKLVRLGGSPVTAGAKQREAHLVLATDKLSVSGSGGCNRINGSFTIEPGRLRFGRMVSTMMACPEGMEQERQFCRCDNHGC